MQHAKLRLVQAHASAAPSKEELFQDMKSRFDACTTEDDFLQVLKGVLSAAGKQPLFNIFHDFYNNYKGASPSGGACWGRGGETLTWFWCSAGCLIAAKFAYMQPA